MKKTENLVRTSVVSCKWILATDYLFVCFYVRTHMKVTRQLNTSETTTHPSVIMLRRLHIGYACKLGLVMIQDLPGYASICHADMVRL